MTTRASTLVGIDLTDLDNFASGLPHDIFEIHRREAPVWWHEPTEHTPDGEGFWSVATYAETLEILRQPEIYSSETGGNRPYGGTLIQDLPTAGIMLNMMDDPRHARIRRLVTTGLTPRMVRRLESELRRRTVLLLEDAAERGEVDFLRDVAAEPPMQMICILLGVPEADRHWLAEAVDQTFDITPGREAGGAGRPEDAEARRRMLEYGIALVGEKRTRPTDDMLSIVVHAELEEVDPPRLSDEELYAFFSLLFSAGAETTRNAIAGGLLALIERPAQLERLRNEGALVPTAVEEMVRWTTPSPSKRRTATTSTRLAPAHGPAADIEPGQKVVFWEGSANRDDAVFGNGMEFEVARQPNPHLGFGHGVHFCLGANLARMEMRVMFEELLARFSAFEPAGPVEWTRSNRHTGMRHMPLRVTPVRPPG